MTNKPIAIVLGGTNPHIELINNLKARGYYTILLDYLENPPAKNVADLHLMVSTLDHDRVLEVASNYKASLVISACVDQANVTACYVAEKLNLPRPYSYRTAIDVTNKGYMKRIMKENDITTSKYVYLDSIDDFKQANLTFPVIVKPADSCGSSGVMIIEREEEFSTYFEFSKSRSRIGRVVVEELIKGDELSVYCFIDTSYKVHILMMSERLSYVEQTNDVLKCYATVTPPQISKEALDRIKYLAERTAISFNLKNTPLHFQVFVENDKVNVIEFAPRVGGGMSYKTILGNTGFDIIDATVNSFLGIPVKIEYTTPTTFYAINLIYAKDGVFDHLNGHIELLNDKVIDEIFIYKAAGSKIVTDTASHCRVGSYIMRDQTREGLFNKMKKAISNIDVIDNNNNSIVDRSSYPVLEEYLVNKNTTNETSSL